MSTNYKTKLLRETLDYNKITGHITYKNDPKRLVFRLSSPNTLFITSKSGEKLGISRIKAIVMMQLDLSENEFKAKIQDKLLRYPAKYAWDNIKVERINHSAICL
jgi:hypothetical protein